MGEPSEPSEQVTRGTGTVRGNHRSRLGDGPQQAPPPTRAPSQRQANKGTYKLIRQHQLEEDQLFADFEAMERCPVMASIPAPVAALPAPPTDGILKKKRGRPPKPRPLVPVLNRPLYYGAGLDAVLREIRAIRNRSLPVGTAVWVKVTGYCAWPALVWSLEHCARATWPDIITSYVPGKLLVRYYGEHSSSWVAVKQLVLWDESNEAQKVEALKVWGKKASRSKLVAATLNELAGRADSRQEELSRMTRMGKTYQQDHLKLAARARHSALLRPSSASSSSAATTADPGPATQESAASEHATSRAASSSKNGSRTEGMVFASGPVEGDPWGVCDVCREEVPNMRCSGCQRWIHAVCCSPAALSPVDFPPNVEWKCQACGESNKVEVLPEVVFLHQAASGDGTAAEHMGLTPDWIITTAAFKILQLPAPTAEHPYIAGLLDPACNNKLHPNIPAEKLYDKSDDGLKPSNSWAGYHIILNPDFRAQVQWKFVNRAIDEVENGNVPAVILICRNSTDTAYFQRLRPYPRVLLRRSAAQFKDYDKSPIGFGVVVFCVAKSDCHELYERFYEGFAQYGEPNIPIDKEFMSSEQFYELLGRLRSHAEQHARDHWVQCSSCGVWRIITYQQLHALRGDATDWTCNNLRPPHTSCATPQSKAELAGMHNAAVIAEASGVATVTDPLEDPEQLSALASALASHQDQHPKHSKLLPALQQALLQQAAIWATANSAAGSLSVGRPTAAVPPIPKVAGNAPAAAGPSRHDAAAEFTVAGGGPFAAAKGEAGPESTAAAAATQAGVTVKTADGPNAADLLLLLGAAAESVKLDLCVSYLCKSAAGQISREGARQLLGAVMGQIGSNIRPEQEQKHQQQRQGIGLSSQHEEPTSGPPAEDVAAARNQSMSGDQQHLQQQQQEGMREVLILNKEACDDVLHSNQSNSTAADIAVTTPAAVGAGSASAAKSVQSGHSHDQAFEPTQQQQHKPEVLTQRIGSQLRQSSRLRWKRASNSAAPVCHKQQAAVDSQQSQHSRKAQQCALSPASKRHCTKQEQQQPEPRQPTGQHECSNVSNARYNSSGASPSSKAQACVAHSQKSRRLFKQQQLEQAEGSAVHRRQAAAAAATAACSRAKLSTIAASCKHLPSQWQLNDRASDSGHHAACAISPELAEPCVIEISSSASTGKRTRQQHKQQQQGSSSDRGGTSIATPRGNLTPTAVTHSPCSAQPTKRQRICLQQQQQQRQWGQDQSPEQQPALDKAAAQCCAIGTAPTGPLNSLVQPGDDITTFASGTDTIPAAAAARGNSNSGRQLLSVRGRSGLQYLAAAKDGKVPSTSVSPGLQHLAAVVYKQVDTWLLLLIQEQLFAWEERQQLIKQALLLESGQHEEQGNERDLQQQQQDDKQQVEENEKGHQQQQNEWEEEEEQRQQAEQDEQQQRAGKHVQHTTGQCQEESAGLSPDTVLQQQPEPQQHGKQTHCDQCVEATCSGQDDGNQQEQQQVPAAMAMCSGNTKLSLQPHARSTGAFDLMLAAVPALGVELAASESQQQPQQEEFERQQSNSNTPGSASPGDAANLAVSSQIEAVSDANPTVGSATVSTMLRTASNNSSQAALVMASPAAKTLSDSNNAETEAVSDAAVVAAAGGGSPAAEAAPMSVTAGGASDTGAVAAAAGCNASTAAETAAVTAAAQPASTPPAAVAAPPLVTAAAFDTTDLVMHTNAVDCKCDTTSIAAVIGCAALPYKPKRGPDGPSAAAGLVVNVVPTAATVTSSSGNAVVSSFAPAAAAGDIFNVAATPAVAPTALPLSPGHYLCEQQQQCQATLHTYVGMGDTAPPVMLRKNQFRSTMSMQQQQQQQQQVLPQQVMMASPSVLLPQQQQQYILVTTPAVPCLPGFTGGAPLSGCSMTQSPLLAVAAAQQPTQQQRDQWQLQLQLAQAAILQQWRQQQLQGAKPGCPAAVQSETVVALLPAFSSRACNTGSVRVAATTAASPADKTRAHPGNCGSHPFDAERAKRVAAQRMSGNLAAAAAAAAKLVHSGALDRHHGGTGKSENRFEQIVVEDAAYLAAQPQLDSAVIATGICTERKVAQMAQPLFDGFQGVSASALPEATTAAAAGVGTNGKLGTAGSLSSTLNRPAAQESLPPPSPAKTAADGPIMCAEAQAGAAVDEGGRPATAAPAVDAHMTHKNPCSTGQHTIGADMDTPAAARSGGEQLTNAADGCAHTDLADAITAATITTDSMERDIPHAAAPAIASDTLTPAHKPPKVKPSVLLQVAPVRLTQGTILRLTGDPLLRAVLLEQPIVMKAVTLLLQQVCLFEQKRLQAIHKQQQCGSHQQIQQEGAAAPEVNADFVTINSLVQPAAADDATEDLQAQLTDQPGKAAAADSMQFEPDNLMFDLHYPGSDLICWDTLESLIHQPGKSEFGRNRHPPSYNQQHFGGGDTGADDEGDVPCDEVAGADASDSEAGAAEFMPSLALARQARVAANYAFLSTLGLGPTAIQSGVIQPLNPDHVAMVTAARQAAKQAAIMKAEQQVSLSQRVLDARRAARRAHEVKLRSALNTLVVDEAQAQQQVMAAQRTLEEVRSAAN